MVEVGSAQSLPATSHQKHCITLDGKGQRALQNTSKGRNLSKELRGKRCPVESVSERDLGGRTLLPKPGAGICHGVCTLKALIPQSEKSHARGPAFHFLLLETSKLCSR